MNKEPVVGDRILIEKMPKGREEGVLLESYEPGVLLLKLDNGYNIGIKKEDIKKVRVIKKVEEKKEEKKISGNKGKPRIDIIVTGGTLSSSLDVKTGGVKFLTSPENLFKFYPEIFEIADIKIKNPFMKWSENMDYHDWQRIAKEVVKSLNDENCQGIIVTHGTDFLHYTASALSFMIKDLNKPVILTYSQRSTDRGSSDATLNLFCSAKMALSDIAEIILVGHGSSNDDFCYALQGNKCRKMHSSSRDAFKAVNTAPIAKISKNGEIKILRDHWKRKKQKAKLSSYFEPKTALIKFYPGQSPEILDYYIREKYKGIIIEMSGLGHVLTEGANNWIPYIKKAIDSGIIVCASGQTIYGSLDPYVYEAGRRLLKMGVVYLKDMLSETAFVKLGYLLGKFKDKKQIENLMLENIAKEFNERLGVEF